MKLIKNKELIRIDQDSEARPPIFLQGEDEQDKIVAFKFLDDGTYALGLFNLSEEDRDMWALFNDTGFDVNAGLAMKFTDVFEGKDGGIHREHLRVRVPAHDCAVFHVELVRA